MRSVKRGEMQLGSSEIAESLKSLNLRKESSFRRDDRSGDPSLISPHGRPKSLNPSKTPQVVRSLPDRVGAGGLRRQSAVPADSFPLIRSIMNASFN